MLTANAIFLIGLVVVVIALVLWIVTISARAKRVSAASDSRLAAQLAAIAENPPATKPFDQETPAERSAQVIAMAEDNDDSPAQIAASTKQERLAELADLHSKGLISDEELGAARAKILAE